MAFRIRIAMNRNYHEYTVYHAETSLYCICPTKDRELIWKGYIYVVDFQTIEKNANDSVQLIILVLQEQKLINQKMFKEEIFN
jgi:hypothetical protein